MMDYTPQEYGIFDTQYPYLGEGDCRVCHGNSMANRHHHTTYVLRDHSCVFDDCHPVEPDPNDGVGIEHNCTLSPCHDWPASIYQPPAGNRWHHNTNLADAYNCTCCHNPDLLDPIGEFLDFLEFPIADELNGLVPTPFSCENCHFGQDVVPNTIAWTPTGNPPYDDPGGAGDTDPANDCPTRFQAGHPSTYDHYSRWGDWYGYYEYGKAILGNKDNHHMQGEGDVGTDCMECHGTNDPTDPNNFDPNNQLLIRYCERCHGFNSLHKIRAHVGDTAWDVTEWAGNGWRPTGFHVSGSSSSVPTVYNSFTSDEMCWGCHADLVPPWTDDPVAAPAIGSGASDFDPDAGCPGTMIVIRGANFGEELIVPDRYVEMVPANAFITNTTDANYLDGLGWGSAYANPLPVYSWTDTRIEARVPFHTVEFPIIGPHRVRVVNEAGPSNYRVFVQTDCANADQISSPAGTPPSGPCGSMIWIENLNSAFDWLGVCGASAPFSPGANFLGGETWVTAVVDFVATEGTYTALPYKSWKNWQIKVWFQNFYEDQERFGEGLEYRNFIQEGDEPTIGYCDQMGLGVYNVYIRWIYFTDDDNSGVNGTLPCSAFTIGDSIYQVVTSDPLEFELNNTPVLFKTNPTDVVDGGPGARPRMLLYGLAFGPAQTGQAAVYAGSPTQYSTDTGRLQQVLNWTNTRVKIKVSSPGTWPVPGSSWISKKRGVWVVNSDGTKTRWLRIRFIP
jgi:hypothetical protein